MHEITLTRRDTAKGFADTPIMVSVNSSQRKMHNGQKITLLEAVPANVKVYFKDTLIWEGSAKPGNRGVVELSVGISEKTAQKFGLGALSADEKTKQASPVENPPLSARASRIKQVMAENERLKQNSKIAFCFGGGFVLAAIGGMIGSSELIIIIGSIGAVISIWAGINQRVEIPAACTKCNAPTAKRTSRREHLNGVRSVQRIIRNQTTNTNEQRTVTVSDIDVVEQWTCVTCDHAWTSHFTYTRE